MIDWAALRAGLDKRDQLLVSIIVCVYNNAALTDKCLDSLFRHEAGSPFEVIVVDNGSDADTAELLRAWSDREPRIRLLSNPENMNFSLGNNLGFAMSRGKRIVFLNNDTEVSPEWLSSLLAPLDRDDVRGVQPKLVFPNGTIQCIGLVFSDHSPFAYPLYSRLPGDAPLVRRRRRFKALTAACLAIRARDFVEAGGFDPLFVNGQEDVDLCLRVGGGKPVFTCATDSVVVHHEGKSAGRGNAIPDNRALFAERWAGRIAGDDRLHYVTDGVDLEGYRVDSEPLAAMGLATAIPTLAYPGPTTAALSAGMTGLRLRIPCPRRDLKDRWGDYHFAAALAKAATSKGLAATIDFLEDWSTPAAKGELEVVLRGLSPWPGSNRRAGGGRRVIWMISHPDKVSDEELDCYDHIFVASDVWATVLSERGLKPSITALLQCTEVERFNLEARAGAPHHERLYVANSRKFLRSMVARAMSEGMRLDIYGEMWDGLAPVDWVKGENVANVLLPTYYAGADVVLNDHWESMRAHGFVSNRVFDVLATGAPLLTDSVEGMPQSLREACTMLDENISLRDAIAIARSRHSLSQRDEIARWIAEEHSFASRLREICAVLR
ncbi:glycosyltransferase [Prosthecomicrobium pneumaticum]|uniref:GT2 family glycosyltransferase n=1 Tax=Prosthecomicrobium pneumaticum TaxID=81895 RepID=A0A7W9CUZ9_9HYPH|nr:glycosyltransferase [Prosthecomicrobium pneumaticum]MBB5752139.1 GT2 family glycosyltransferase [Prosthecomicrobium pneumaticum]